MRICLLTTQPLDADPFPDDDWPCDPRPFIPEDDWHLEVLEGRQSSVRRVEELIAERRFDLFFNLCDGATDQDLPGIEVIEAMERAGVPFTGAVSACYEPSREAMKEACRRIGIRTPASVTVRGEADVERAAERLRFPLFVKHPSSGASVDLSMLELTPSCGVFHPPRAPGSADLCLLHDAAAHEGFARQLVAAAMTRALRSRQSAASPPGGRCEPRAPEPHANGDPAFAPRIAGDPVR